METSSPRFQRLWAWVLLLSGIAIQESASQDTPLAPPRIGFCSWSKHGYPFPTTQPACPLPVDDKSKDFAPWSYRPFCLWPSNSATSSDKYCVFTSLTFRGRGLSVISSPELVANFVNALDDTAVPPRLRDHPASAMAPKAIQRMARPYAVKRVPGRGKGLVARRRVPKWEDALIGFPILIARSDFLSELTSEERQPLKDRAMSQLPQLAQEAIMSLARSSGDSDALEDILRTNIFSIEVAGVQHFALHIEESRVNHDCRPNTFWRYSASTMAQEVVALREISIGEEFTHSYLPLGLPSPDRKHAIQRWGFKCTCSLCTADKNTAFASDIRRTRLVEIYQTFEEEGNDGVLSKERIEALASEMMLLVNGEDLQPQLCEYYAVIARAYLSIDDFEEARYYAGQSELFWIRYGTEEHDNVEGVRELWDMIAKKEKEKEQKRQQRLHPGTKY